MVLREAGQPAPWHASSLGASSHSAVAVDLRLKEPVMRAFACSHCGQLLFFENSHCLRCGTALGFLPVGIMRRYERGADGTWRDGLLMDLLADELR